MSYGRISTTIAISEEGDKMWKHIYISLNNLAQKGWLNEAGW